ncbi:signal peptidase II [Alkalithermobacter thermoalcaliphilus JW-YL-7 = DSM 7308]|uniref:Lipoprotein signal peptidase n=1 Tax=Alkalithermobacter thermoalcaliphilus JW-YL-7 = DSM 7308 TaxID=1121328 RepID=A0A150FQU7_CLOPD|nr:Lipoprotein signal peptidase [[Clostridium] paradoxum JW-YL-7 = DSM 7308]SHK96998.1 signal peptidase II [[Clostridium] paradoxum JW-YL-7 = DSM 7308]
MGLIYIFLLVILDQLTKKWAIDYLSNIGSIPVIENIFYLTYVENKGAAFGIFHGKVNFLIIVTGIITGYIIYYMYSNKNLTNLTKLALSLIVSGALGNLIDRIRLGFVVDFFDFRIWPVFNVADICVVIGSILISYIILTNKE